MGLFDDKKEVSRKELKTALKKSPMAIPGTGGKRYTRKERASFEKELFSPKYGSRISKGDYKIALENLRKSRFESVLDKDKGKMRKRTAAEKRSIESKRRFMKNIGGF